jgi:hypothetical protein
VSPGIFPSFTILRSKGAKNIIILDIWNFYFYSDFDVFFPLGSSRWELSEVCQHIFSIFYHFRDKRGQRVQKCHFPWNVKFLLNAWRHLYWNLWEESFKINPIKIRWKIKRFSNLGMSIFNPFYLKNGKR